MTVVQGNNWQSSRADKLIKGKSKLEIVYKALMKSNSVKYGDINTGLSQHTLPVPQYMTLLLTLLRLLTESETTIKTIPNKNTTDLIIFIIV